ncbi:hypothetical protein RA279_29315, partial [Pseudomonas syringae pv. tagetis]|uniref:hypothetical protein n=1 Tax=Pseudomonas syringae group genomosp. 7 TaxID=251699 RepID=UPI00377024D7
PPGRFFYAWQENVGCIGKSVFYFYKAKTTLSRASFHICNSSVTSTLSSPLQDCAPLAALVPIKRARSSRLKQSAD